MKSFLSLLLLLRAITIDAFLLRHLHCDWRPTLRLSLSASKLHDLQSLSRTDLQALAKTHGIKANGKSSDIIAELQRILSTSPSTTSPAITPHPLQQVAPVTSSPSSRPASSPSSQSIIERPGLDEIMLDQGVQMSDIVALRDAIMKAQAELKDLDEIFTEDSEEEGEEGATSMGRSVTPTSSAPRYSSGSSKSIEDLLHREAMAAEVALKNKLKSDEIKQVLASSHHITSHRTYCNSITYHYHTTYHHIALHTSYNLPYPTTITFDQKKIMEREERIALQRRQREQKQREEESIKSGHSMLGIGSSGNSGNSGNSISNIERKTQPTASSSSSSSSSSETVAEEIPIVTRWQAGGVVSSTNPSSSSSTPRAEYTNESMGDEIPLPREDSPKVLSKNPTDGVKLQGMLEYLEDAMGWEGRYN